MERISHFVFLICFCVFALLFVQTILFCFNDYLIVEKTFDLVVSLHALFQAGTQIKL